MEFSILHTDDCPNWVEAEARLRSALAARGLLAGCTISTTLLATSEEASLVPFAGSPTILIDGVDLFPPAPTTNDLACRVYRSGSRLVGLPAAEDFEAALEASTRG